MYFNIGLLSENVLKVSPRFSNLFEHKLYINDYEVILYKFVFCVDWVLKDSHNQRTKFNSDLYKKMYKTFNLNLQTWMPPMYMNDLWTVVYKVNAYIFHFWLYSETWVNWFHVHSGWISKSQNLAMMSYVIKCLIKWMLSIPNSDLHLWSQYTNYSYNYHVQTNYVTYILNPYWSL